MTQESNFSDTTAPIRVMIVDDHDCARRGFRALLEAYTTRIVVVAEAPSAREALAMMGAQTIDILLAELLMQGNIHSGLELVASMHERHPTVPVIIVTGHNDNAMVLRVYKAGASGFVSKEGEAVELLRAIEMVHGGAMYFPRTLQRLLDDDRRKPTLSRREQEICDLIALDMSSKKIARVLDINSRRVDTHRWNIATKLGKRGMELHHHCIDDLNARFPTLARRDAKAKLVAILAHLGISHADIGTRLGLQDDDSRKPTLTPRQQQICDLIAIDLSNKEIARILGIDYRSVHAHRFNIITKLGKSGLELHHHCMDDLNARFPTLARRDAKAQLVTILANHGASHALICRQLGLTVEAVAALLKT